MIPLVSYDWDHNRLKIMFTTSLEYVSHDITPAKEWCKRITQFVRSSFGVPSDASLSVAWLFQHDGFQKKNTPKNLREEIENITKIRVVVYGGTIYKPFGKLLSTCESPLKGKEVHFIEKE